MLYLLETISKNRIKNGGALYLAVLVFFLIPSYGVSEQMTVIGTGTITAERLSVRTKPDRYSKLVFVITKGQNVKILEKTDGWLRINYENNTGFIRNREKYVHLNTSFPKTVKAVSIKKKHDREPSVNNTDKADKISIKKKEAEAIDQKITDTNKEIKEFSDKESLLIKGLDDVEINLNNARKKVREISPVLKTIEKDLNLLIEKKIILSESTKKNERYAKKRLIALYKISQLGKIQIVASSDSIYDFLSRKNAIERILKSDMTLIDSQYERQHELQIFMNNLEQKKIEKQKLTTLYKSQIRIISSEKKKRTKILTAIRKEKKVRLAAIDALNENAKKLEETIQKLELTLNRKNVFKNSFIANKGRLQMPVEGNIMSYFGTQKSDNINIKTFQNGIEIEADRGEPIRSVWNGEVLYADWLRGYGNMIIIYHGDNYYTLYAHTEELFKRKGDFVETHEVIATIGDTGSLKGALLHFEVRHREKSVNPMNWLQIR